MNCMKMAPSNSTGAPLTDGKIDGVQRVLKPERRAEKKRRLLTCAALRTERVAIYWSNGNVREKGINNNGRKQGVWLTFTRGGDLSIRATYALGLLTGKYTLYYSNGQMQGRDYNRNQKDK